MVWAEGFRPLLKGSVRKNDGAVAVDDGAVVDVVADATSEGGALAVAAEAGEVVEGVEMGDGLVCSKMENRPAYRRSVVLSTLFGA